MRRTTEEHTSCTTPSRWLPDAPRGQNQLKPRLPPGARHRRHPVYAPPRRARRLTWPGAYTQRSWPSAASSARPTIRPRRLAYYSSRSSSVPPSAPTGFCTYSSLRGTVGVSSAGWQVPRSAARRRRVTTGPVRPAAPANEALAYQFSFYIRKGIIFKMYFPFLFYSI